MVTINKAVVIILFSMFSASCSDDNKITQNNNIDSKSVIDTLGEEASNGKSTTTLSRTDCIKNLLAKDAKMSKFTADILCNSDD